MAEAKIARLCWNTEGWRKPSGRAGKSKSKKTYEHRAGFGSEEWLLDTTKLIGGWHYAFLQPIGIHHQKYVGKVFDISLYSIDRDTRRRWWIGEIRGVQVIPPKESKQVFAQYRKNGWFAEMEQQLRAVGASVEKFRKSKAGNFVVRFRAESPFLKILDTPKEFSRYDSAVPSSYYVLLKKKKAPHLANKKFVFRAGHKPLKHSAEGIYEKSTIKFDLVQNKIQNAVFEQLCRQYGKVNVGTENPTGDGSEVDIVVRLQDGSFAFYEIKTSFAVRLNIRQAIGQLLEYAFWKQMANVRRLIVVSDKTVTDEAKRYLDRLRKKFGIPIHYQRFDPTTNTLEPELH